MAKKLEIKLVRGLAGKRKDQKEVAFSLGLKKTNQTKLCCISSLLVIF